MNYSKQRNLIEYLMKDRFDHPTAGIIYEEAKGLDKKISLGTVYRNLNLLTENKKIKRLSFDNEDHFDPNMKEHMHFFCKKCGKIFDINIDDNVKQNLVSKNQNNNFKIEEMDIVIKGTCDKCK